MPSWPPRYSMSRRRESALDRARLPRGRCDPHSASLGSPCTTSLNGRRMPRRIPGRRLFVGRVDDSRGTRWARFWGKVRGFSGRLRALRAEGATSEETPRLAGRAHYQARFAGLVRNATKKGLPRSDAPRVLVETKGGPTHCCTPGWISVASVSTSTCSTRRVRRSTSVRLRRMLMACST